MKKRINMKKIMLCSLMLFFISSLVNAVYITPAYVDIDFSPGKEVSIKFRVGGADKITIYKQGDLAEYVSLSKIHLANGEEFIATIKFPDYIEKPGRHTVDVGAVEGIYREGTAVGIAAIESPIWIDVPYPGKYIDATFNVPNGNINEIIPIRAVISNLGTSDITSLKLQLDVYDNNINIKTLHSDARPIPSKSTESFLFNLNTTGFRAGSYNAKLMIIYDGNIDEHKKEFRIGELYMNVLNHTKEFHEESIEKFDVWIKNEWNGAVENVYAEIDVISPDQTIKRTLKTPSANIPAWKPGLLSTYFDTRGLSTGEYNTIINIHYANKTTALSDIILIKKKTGLTFNTTILLILTIIILIILNIIFLIKRKKGK